MIPHILETLKQYEINNNVEIIFSVVYGSREFGHERKNSDYDIMIVYKGEILGTEASSSEQYKCTSISYRGYHIDYFLLALEDSDTYHWNYINAKHVLINKNNFKENCLEKYSYDKEIFIRNMFYFVKSVYDGSIVEKEMNPYISAYLKCVSTIMRIKWLEEFNNLNFPSTKETFMYLNNDQIIETKKLLTTIGQHTDINSILNTYIEDELERLRVEYDIEI